MMRIAVAALKAEAELDDELLFELLEEFEVFEVFEVFELEPESDLSSAPCEEAQVVDNSTQPPDEATVLVPVPEQSEVA